MKATTIRVNCSSKESLDYTNLRLHQCGIISVASSKVMCQASANSVRLISSLAVLKANKIPKQAIF